MRHGLVDRDASQGTMFGAGGHAHITIGHHADDDAMAVDDGQEAAVAIAHDCHNGTKVVVGCARRHTRLHEFFHSYSSIPSLRTRFATVVPGRRL